MKSNYSNKIGFNKLEGTHTSALFSGSLKAISTTSSVGIIFQVGMTLHNMVRTVITTGFGFISSAIFLHRKKKIRKNIYVCCMKTRE